MKKLIVILGLSIAVSGCVLNEKTTDLKYIQPAKYEEPVPIEYPAPPEPAPVDQQQRRIEPFEPEPAIKSKNSVEATTNARLNSTQKARDDQFFNAITVYHFKRGLVYEVYTCPNNITTLIFEEGEEFDLADLGGNSDSTKWDQPKLINRGKRIHLFIRPVRPHLSTNLVIPTNKRTYFIELKSYENTYHTAVEWQYPEDDYQRTADTIYNDYKKEQDTVYSIDLNNINMDYEIEGNAPFRPVSVFDDGQKTVIKFPENISTGELPPFFVLTENKEVQLVNYRFKSGSYIVDRVISGGVLQMGSENSMQKVFIYNKKSKSYNDFASSEYQRYSHAR